MKRIGMFQYEWPLQIHTMNMASNLAQNGFQVDLFLYECDATFVNLSTFPTENITVISRFDNPPSKKIFNRMRTKVLKMCGIEKVITVLDTVVDQSLDIIGETRYDYFIGIEKKGLIWAGRLSALLDIPFLYYSLELYIEGHPGFVGNVSFAALRTEELKYHARSTGTIIQDAARAAVLLESNLIKKTDLIDFPISVSGQAIRNRGHYLHDRLAIDHSKKIILYFGSVNGNRGIHELLIQAARFDENFVLVVHGPVFVDISLEELQAEGVLFSKDIIDSSEIPDMIASAYIGLAFYRNDVVNDRLTAFSSEKIARYMQSGLPIIAYANESYGLLMEQFHCGELIDHMSQLSEAVVKIAVNYDYYRNNAFQAFEKFYSCEKNMGAVLRYLSNDTSNTQIMQYIRSV